MFWFLVFGSNHHGVHLLASGFPFWNQELWLIVLITSAGASELRSDSGPGFRVGHLPSPRGPAFSRTHRPERHEKVSDQVWALFMKILETNSQNSCDYQSCHRLSYIQAIADLNPPRSKRLTFSSYRYSVVWKKKKPQRHQPSLPASSLHLMRSLLLRCLIRSLSGRPNRITSAARSTDSFLSTPALSRCSSGVSEILACCGGPAQGRLPPTQRWVPGGVFRRARHTWTWLKLRH